MTQKAKKNTEPDDKSIKVVEWKGDPNLRKKKVELAEKSEES